VPVDRPPQEFERCWIAHEVKVIASDIFDEEFPAYWPPEV
jgi:hypothetical protein